MLRIENLEVAYGNILALKGISLEVNRGEIVTLIGANGAGKTTTLRTVSGIIDRKGGNILFEDQDIDRLEPHKRAEMGIIQVPEGRRIFANMSVLENLEMGAYLKRARKSAAENLEMVMERFPILKERSRQMAGTLSGGEQQMLAIGRALMSEPRILLMDEPSMGLAPIVVQDIFSIIQWINKERGITILLVEQNAHMALRVASRAYVLQTGSIVASGGSQELLENDEVRRAYLG